MRTVPHARSLGLLMALTLALTLWIPVAYADDIRNTQGFRKAVTLAGIRSHLAQRGRARRAATRPRAS